MARSRKTSDRPASRKRCIEQYGHSGGQRRNKPPFGPVTETFDPGDLGNRCTLAPV
jgi:hypothetical protein